MPAPVQQVYPAPNRMQLAAEGSYLVVTNPTVGSGVTWVDSGAAAQQAFVDTGPNFWIHNNEAPGGRTLYLDYLKLISGKVGAAGTSLQFAIILDPATRTIATNNMLSVVPVTTASAYANLATPTVLVQNSATASVFSASSALKKLVARGALGGINIVAHVYGLTFGDFKAAKTSSGNLSDSAGAPSRCFDQLPAIGISPGTDCSIYFWAPASTDNIDPEFEIGMIARP
jgi:hypothetical protein